MAQIKWITFVHPGQAYRLRYPGHWEHLAKDDGRSCGFGPHDRDDVGLWITILPASVDTNRIEEALPEIFEQAMHEGEAKTVRLDPSLRHFGLKADTAEKEQGGHFWILAGGDLVLFASSQTPAAERESWNPQFERLMASLEITRDRELLLRKAANEALKGLCELHPEQGYRFDEGGILGGDQRISLDNLYSQVAAS